jgi:uncharacterized coiled-coil protein SlyX
MSDLTREYFDEQFEQVTSLIETLATSTAKRFDTLEAEVSETRADIKALAARVGSEATDTDVLHQDLRRLRETVEENHGSRISNLEAQAG